MAIKYTLLIFYYVQVNVPFKSHFYKEAYISIQTWLKQSSITTLTTINNTKMNQTFPTTPLMYHIYILTVIHRCSLITYKLNLIYSKITKKQVDGGTGLCGG